MPIPTDISDLSETPSSNSPSGSEPVGTQANEYLQAAFAFIKQIFDKFLPLSGGTMTGPITLSANPVAALQPVTMQYGAVTYQAALGYTPVQQGTGIGQLGNAIKIGWSGSRVKATVDGTDFGNLVFDSNLNAGLSTKQNVGDYATNTALNNGLAGKQAAGFYVFGDNGHSIGLTWAPTPTARLNVTIDGTVIGFCAVTIP